MCIPFGSPFSYRSRIFLLLRLLALLALVLGVGVAPLGVAAQGTVNLPIVPPGGINPGTQPPTLIPATDAFTDPACSDIDLKGVDITFGAQFAPIRVPSPQRSNPEWKAIILDSSQPPHLQPPTILEGFVSPQPNDQTSKSQSTSEVAEEDLPWTHYTHDFTFKVVPDPAYQHLLSSWNRYPGDSSPPIIAPPDPHSETGCPQFFVLNDDNQCVKCPPQFTLSSDGRTCGIPPETCPDLAHAFDATCQHTDMEVEWENASLMDEKEGSQRDLGAVPEFVWPAVGDRVWVAGRWIFDCGHPGVPEVAPIRRFVKYSTEIHPPRALVAFRLNHPALDSFVVPRASAPNFPPPQSYLPVTGVPTTPFAGGPTNVPVTEADIFISVNGTAASDICSIVVDPCSAFGGHTGPIIPVNDRNYVFDIYPPGTNYHKFAASGAFVVTAPVLDASLQWRVVDHFSELPLHACGTADGSGCVTVDPMFCLIDAATPPPDQTETACPPLPSQPTRLRLILPFAGTNANYFAKSILLGWDDVPTGAPQSKIANKMSGRSLLAKSAIKKSGGAHFYNTALKLSGTGLLYNSAFKNSGGHLAIKSASRVSAQLGGVIGVLGTPLVRTFKVRLRNLTIKQNGSGPLTSGDWRVFVNVGGQYRYIDPFFDTDANGNNVCLGGPLTENAFVNNCYRFDNTPWTVSVEDGTPIHVAVGGFVARGVEDHNSPLFLCPNFFGGCDAPPSFSPFQSPFLDLALDNDDRIGTYEFDLVSAEGYAPPAPFTTTQFDCTIFTPLNSCSLQYLVDFGVIEIPPATAPSSAPLVIGLPNFTGPAGTYITAATPMIPQTGDPNAEGFQYRFHAQGGPLPIYPFLPPQPYPVHWAHVDLAPGVHSAEVTIDGANSGDGPYDFQYSAESFGNLLEPRHTTTVILDTTPPAISITIPIKTTYLLNQAINANYACTDGGSGVATCTGTVANGSSIDTSSVGDKTFTVNATDRVGNVSPPQSVTYTVTANFVPTTMAGNIIAKSGPQNARVWTLSLLNNGPGGAFGTAINSFTLTQTFGAACTPVIGTPFPLAVTDLAPAQTGTANLTIDFTGCAAAARFTTQFTFSANAGAMSGNVVRYNQYE